MNKKIYKQVIPIKLMATFHCNSCGFKFTPKSKTRTIPPKVCPSCSRKDTIVDVSNLMQDILNEVK